MFVFSDFFFGLEYVQVGGKEHPSDYFVILCLGGREKVDCPPSTLSRLSQKQQRMIQSGR